MKKIDLTGKKFNRLLVIKAVGINKHRQKLWLCQCNCNNQIIVIGNSLKKGNTKSCGCLKLEILKRLKICNPSKKLIKQKKWLRKYPNYQKIHNWLKKHKGKAEICIDCGLTSKTHKIEWSNIDHKYKRNLDDFQPRCDSCHKIHDNKLRNKKLKRNCLTCKIEFSTYKVHNSYFCSKQCYGISKKGTSFHSSIIGKLLN